jgi:hypothetical protein
VSLVERPASSPRPTFDGPALIRRADGRLWVRAWFGDDVHVFELEPEDACYLPAGSRHEYRNAGGTAARAICGIAPRYLP